MDRREVRPFHSREKNFILLLDSMPRESASFSFSQKERQMKCEVVLYKNLYFTHLGIAIIRYSQRISHFMFQKPARVRMCVLVENRSQCDLERFTEDDSSLL